MADFVLDTSLTMTWCFNDEASPYANAVLECLSSRAALAPGIWPLDVSNVLLVAERNQRINPRDSKGFMQLLSALPIQVKNLAEQRIFDAVFLLAREQGFSCYNAVYLDLALQNSLQLATLDQGLRKAAAQVGIALYLADRP